MVFSLANEVSAGSVDSNIIPAGSTQGVDLESALHHVLQGPSPHDHHTDRHDLATRKDDKHTNLEIIVNTDVLVLRGAGVEVTPAVLSGHVVFNLAESTPVKQITLQFRGKARLPPLDVGFSNPPMTYIVCNHEWSFLEGEKKHSHTLKAGRHLFPFQLNVGGSLPSTVYTSAFKGASVAYKLRAIAMRRGFAHNLQAQKAITLLRCFTPEALEYQQSLEIENTWPEKVMYSITVPHKAWAAGDDLTAAVKIIPMAKGVQILDVVTTLDETVKVHSRTGWQESTKSVSTARHEFRNGQAVWTEHQDHRTRSSLPHQRQPSLGYAMSSLPTSSPCPSISAPPLASHSRSPETSSASARSPFPNTEPGDESHSVPINSGLSEGHISTKLDISLPLCMTPTHTLEPIVASHRIRWKFLISNSDGHTSELRCSLPLHILDYHCLNEARSATAPTRRLLFGGPESSEERNSDLEQLPSYPSHIRDRIANMYIPDQAVLRVTNPWVHQGISPAHFESSDQDGRHSEFTSGVHTPLEGYYVSPPMGNDLEYVNSELLLSLSQNTPPPIETRRDNPSTPETAPGPTLGLPTARRASEPPSRVQSRPASPDRDRDGGPWQRQHPHPRNRSRRSSGAGSTGTGTHLPDGAPQTYIHENGTASRSPHDLFHATMKPLTSLMSSFALSPRHFTAPSSPLPRPSLPNAHTHSRQQPQPQPQQQQATGSLPRTVPVASHSLLHRAFTEVPDYDIASRGFLGGVTPLETLQGLPSYQEAEMQRSRSESDLASMAHRGSITPLLPLHAEPEPGPGRSVARESADAPRSS
ncbi:hypothetical protein F5148DRAFT_112999 [Russula earlei]|uniref:Uncharacterized protein n=1 Tax=Russula earlei TaxID=71964 RepID=A0ACC0U772_9AGAM|nr:hypothetical protein F5148DRAFT_112999 [Russula earlei]